MHLGLSWLGFQRAVSWDKALDWTGGNGCITKSVILIYLQFVAFYNSFASALTLRISAFCLLLFCFCPQEYNKHSAQCQPPNA